MEDKDYKVSFIGMYFDRYDYSPCFSISHEAETICVNVEDIMYQIFKLDDEYVERSITYLDVFLEKASMLIPFDIKEPFIIVLAEDGTNVKKISVPDTFLYVPKTEQRRNSLYLEVSKDFGLNVYEYINSEEFKHVREYLAGIIKEYYGKGYYDLFGDVQEEQLDEQMMYSESIEFSPLGLKVRHY